MVNSNSPKNQYRKIQSWECLSFLGFFFILLYFNVLISSLRFFSFHTFCCVAVLDIKEGARGVMVIVIGNRLKNPSSNPERDYLHFKLSIPLGNA